MTLIIHEETEPQAKPVRTRKIQNSRRGINIT